VERLETLVLRMHPAVSAHAPPGERTRVLRRADTGHYAEITEEVWHVLERANGQRTLAELATCILDEPGTSLRNLTEKVAELRAKGILLPPVPVTARRTFRGTWSLGWCPALPETLRGQSAVAMWAALAVAAVGMAALPASPLTAPSRITGVTMAACWLGVALALSTRALAGWLALAVLGTRPWKVGVAFTWWVVHLHADTRDARAGGRRGVLAVALAEAAACAVLAAAGKAWSWHHPGDLDALTGLTWGLGAYLWWLLRPWGRGRVAQVARAFTGNRRINADATAYLARRMLPRLASGAPFFPGELTILALALAVPAWAYVGLRGVVDTLHAGLLPALAALLSSGASAHAEAAGTLVLLATLVVVATMGPVALLLAWLRRTWRAHRTAHRRPVEDDEVGDVVAALGSHALLASLPRASLASLARASAVVDIHAGARAVGLGRGLEQTCVVARGRLRVLRERETGRLVPVGWRLAGDGMGEETWLGQESDPVVVEAWGPVRLVVVPRVALQGMPGETWAGCVRHAGWARALQRTPLWAGLGLSHVGRFLRQVTVRTLQPGEVLWRAGDVGQHAALVDRGEVVLERAGQPPQVASPGRLLGAHGLLAPAPRAETAVAVTQVEVVELTRPGFLEALAATPFPGLSEESPGVGEGDGAP
jgi:CRP-like cAMP-binding protein